MKKFLSCLICVWMVFGIEFSAMAKTQDSLVSHTAYAELKDAYELIEVALNQNTTQYLSEDEDSSYIKGYCMPDGTFCVTQLIEKAVYASGYIEKTYVSNVVAVIDEDTNLLSGVTETHSNPLSKSGKYTTVVSTIYYVEYFSGNTGLGASGYMLRPCSTKITQKSTTKAAMIKQSAAVVEGSLGDCAYYEEATANNVVIGREYYVSSPCPNEMWNLDFNGGGAFAMAVFEHEVNVYIEGVIDLSFKNTVPKY